MKHQKNKMLPRRDRLAGEHVSSLRLSQNHKEFHIKWESLENLELFNLETWFILNFLMKCFFFFIQFYWEVTDTQHCIGLGCTP